VARVELSAGRTGFLTVYLAVPGCWRAAGVGVGLRWRLREEAIRPV
jgi:hypothetical protein